MMNTIHLKPSVEKPLRYTLAYVLYALFAILGLIVTVNIHSALFQISLLAPLFGLSNFVYVWGAFILFAIYTVCMVMMEGVMNRSAKNGSILRVGARIFAIEALLALLAWVAPMVARWIFIQ